ncbi:MAG: hypothetical protein GXO30_07760 [Epsilonproteobacteria bacterium]|nr:hypothetical protein [Campylobacterota bacterium]
MLNETCLELLKSVIDTQKDLVVVFRGEIPVVINKAFCKFLGFSSFEDYIVDAPPFVEHFAMHPSYFNKEKVEAGEVWFDAILKLDALDRVVSMINTKYEPKAFTLHINNSIDDFKIVSFEDITHDLIKRIMIENNANIDKKSGAYAKEYFLQVCKNYEDAASFNEKIICLSSISISAKDELDAMLLSTFVSSFKSMIRQDDMLVRWSEDKFIFIYLVENEEKANLVISKLKGMVNIKLPSSLTYSYSSVFQKNKQTIKELLSYLSL